MYNYLIGELIVANDLLTGRLCTDGRYSYVSIERGDFLILCDFEEYKTNSGYSAYNFFVIAYNGLILRVSSIFEDTLSNYFNLVKEM